MNRKVFLDTSAMILFLHGKISKEGKEIFQQSLSGKYKLMTTTRCIDELIFKEMVILGKEKYGLQTKTVEKLRKKVDIVKKIGKELKPVINGFLKAYKIEILDIKKEWLFELPSLMEELGIFGNDLLIVRAMRSRNIKYLLTADRDFENVGNYLDIKIINARGD